MASSMASSIFDISISLKPMVEAISLANARMEGK
jgi:hypothetical protein